jgi:hypothetical protein
VEKPLRKSLVRRLTRIWENNIKIELGKLGYKAGEWMELAQYHIPRQALVLAVLDLRVLPQKAHL